jgi:acyl carrier protein
LRGPFEPAMTVAIEYFDDIGKLQADPRATLALAQAHAPFDRPEWWALLQRECGIDPIVALAVYGERALVWPLARTGRSSRSLANFYSFTARPLASGPDALAELIAPLARDLRRRFSRLTLDRLPVESGVVEPLCEALRVAGWSVSCEQDDTNHWLDVDGRTFEDYFAARPGRLRTTIARKGRKVVTETTRFVDDARWRSYEDIYRASWKPEEASFSFWRAFAEAEAAEGRLRFGFAYDSDERPIAAQLWTVEHATAYIHKLAHLPDAERLSPGSVLTATMMRDAIDEDHVKTVDFGTGDDGYKRDWMEGARPRYRIEAHDPRHWRNWPVLVRNALKARLAGGEKGGYRPANAAEGAPMATSHATENAIESAIDDPVDAKLRQVLADILALDAERVAAFDAETGLFGHLPELDSQAVATLLTEIEDRFGIVIDDEDVDGEMLETFGGLRDFVRAKCAAAA